MEHHHVLWVNPLQMAIFNSYVSLPEGSELELCLAFRKPCEVLHGNRSFDDLFLAQNDATKRAQSGTVFPDFAVVR